VIFWVVVVAYILGLVERRKQVQHTVLERNPEEAAVPIVVHKEAAEVVQVVRMAVAHKEVEVAVPIVVVHKGVAVVQAARMAVAHREAVEAAVPNLVVAVGLDHKTRIIPSCQICNHFQLIHSRQCVIPYYRCQIPHE
jgi:hypothetical protein